MPNPVVTTPIYGWRLVRKALSLLDVWDYWPEYEQSILDIENTVYGGPLPLVVASIADTVAQMTAADAALTVVTGSASGYIRRTPDATSMPVGWTRRIKNVSSEFIAVDNGVSPTMKDIIPPGGECSITLKVASLAGTWQIDRVNYTHGWDSSVVPNITVIGDSTSTGYGSQVGWPEQLADKIGATVTTHGVAGYTVADIIAVEMIKGIGLGYWDFLDGSYFPWTAQGGTTLSIVEKQLKIVRDATYGRANAAVCKVGETYTISGVACGDGTCNPVLVDGGFGDIWTGTSSTGKQAFSVSRTMAGTGVRLDCRGGGAGGFVTLSGITITKTSNTSEASNSDLMFIGGVNDIGASVSAAVTKEGVGLIYKSAKKAGLRVIQLGILPINNDGSAKDQLLSLNDWYRANCPGPFVETGVLGDYDYDQVTNTLDGTHPTTAGHTLIMGEVAKVYNERAKNGNY